MFSGSDVLSINITYIDQHDANAEGDWEICVVDESWEEARSVRRTVGRFIAFSCFMLCHREIHMRCAAQIRSETLEETNTGRERQVRFTIGPKSRGCSAFWKSAEGRERRSGVGRNLERRKGSRVAVPYSCLGSVKPLSFIFSCVTSEVRMRRISCNRMILLRYHMRAK